MSAELLAVAVQATADVLDTHRRAWLIGVAHLAGLPPETEFGQQDAREVLDVAGRTSAFPSGPVSYVDGGYEIASHPDYLGTTVRGPSAPHLELQLGLGTAGFVAVGFTRTGILDDGTECPGAVLLSDCESVIADTWTLAIGAALQIGYRGRIEACFAIAYTREDETVPIFALDDDTGVPVARGTASTDDVPRVVRHLELTDATSAREIHVELYSAARDLASFFGSTTPELVPTPYAEGHDDYGPDVLAFERRVRP